MDCDMTDPRMDEIFTDLLVHLIMPPNCPQAQTSSHLDINSQLLALVRESAASFVEHCSDTDKPGWQSIDQLLSQWLEIQADNSTHPVKLDEAMTALPVHGGIAMYIRAQNAGILMHRTDLNRLNFEFFEAAPKNANVISPEETHTLGRLTRRFPGSIIACPWSLVMDEGFRHQFGKHLCGLNEETIHGFQNSVTTTSKADIHDTPHPGMVTEMIANILAAHGEIIHGQRTIKHTREEVYLCDGAKRPWRRTPLWLVIRVAIERSLSYAFPSDGRHVQYKNFILYFLAQLAKKACRDNISHDLRHLLSVKLARRLAKLKPHGLDFVVNAATSAASELSLSIRELWTGIQKAEKDARLVPALDTKASLDQMILQLNGSRRYVSSTMTAQYSLYVRSSFKPRIPRKLQIGKDGLPLLSAIDVQIPVVLVDYEDWIAYNLDSWLDSCDKSENTCARLKELIEKYLPATMAMYHGCCERFSISILTTIETWVALDKVQCALNPLLAQYSPGIPPKVLEPLLLRKKDQSMRALAVECYLTTRQHPPVLVVLDFFSNMERFLMKFFDQSKPHQKFRTAIDSEATATRQQKTLLWQELQEQHESFLQQAMDRDHDRGTQQNAKDHDHDQSTCEKCILKAKAEDLKIEKHEWPLPEDEDAQKVLIMELYPPAGFRAWRDATWTVIHDLGRPDVVQNPTGKAPNNKKAEDDLFLNNYNALSRRYVRGESRIMLKAIKKPVQLTGRKTRKIPAELEDVCIKNDSVWAFYDKQKAVLLSQHKRTPSFSRFCIYQLPEGPYRHLQWVMDSTDHSDNQVVARQNDCSTNINLVEHYEFGSLRAGRCIQLMNILRALAGQSLNVRSLAVQTLISQAIWEFGPAQKDTDNSATGNADLRVTHAAFNDELFCEQLLLVLGTITDQMTCSTAEQNTDGLVLVAILILRVASFASSYDVRIKAFKSLRKLREKSLRLLCRLTRNSAISTNSKANVSGTQLFKLATLIRMTFDVDVADISHVLHDDHDVEDLTTASLIVRENLPGDLRCLPYHTKEMVLKGFETGKILEQALRSLIIKRSNGLTAALLNRCEGLTLEGKWSFLPAPGDRNPWVENQTRSPKPRVLHYNIITGEFLVDGRHIQMVPPEIEREPIYRRVFGEHPLHVLPSSIPGMQYTTVNTIADHKIHFRYLEERVTIRASIGTRLLELIPSEIFQGDLPDFFVQEFVHWLDLKTKVVEFRPKAEPWSASSNQIWRLDFNTSKMYSSTFYLIPQHHPTFQNVHSILRHLELSNHILVLLDDTKSIQIELPRFGLTFAVNGHGNLISKDYDAIVDNNQDVGCLYGLHNRLVLRSHNAKGPTQRHILVPFGTVIIAKTQIHVSISIDHKNASQVKHFRYRCDEYLRIIQTSADRLSNLFLSYLHGVTAFVLPDPWTEQTGTQRALQILRQPLLRSTKPLNAAELSILSSLAYLTPDRQYKPIRKQEMQEVSWNPDLSPFSQHEDFYFVAKEIKDFAIRYAMLYDDVQAAAEFVQRDNHELHWRARTRNSWFRAPDLIQSRTQAEDYSYHSRDESCSERGENVYRTAMLFRSCPLEHNVHPNLFEDMLHWPSISGFGDEYLPKSFQEIQSVSLEDVWGSLFETCRLQSLEGSWRLSFLLSQFAYKDADIFQHIETFIAMACSGRFRDMLPPESRSYELSVGLTPSTDALDTAIRAHKQPFKWIPPRGLSKAQKEKRLHAAREEHRRLVEDQVEKLRDNLTRQWPGGPIAPASVRFPNILVENAVNSCATIFSRASQNNELCRYIQQVQVQLKQIPAPANEADLPEWPEVERLPGSGPKPVCPDLLTVLKSAQAPSLPRLQPGLTFEFKTVTPNSTRLEAVLSPYYQRPKDHNLYAFSEQLNESYRAYQKFQTLVEPKDDFIKSWELENHHKAMKKQSEEALSVIKEALQPQSDPEGLLIGAGTWVTINSYTLLVMISRSLYDLLPRQWMQTLISFGTRLALCQRAERLVKLVKKASKTELIQELRCTSQQGWIAEDCPDWLLIEIENNITIRPHQAKLAKEMCSPKSGANSVYQVNMGEGKTSIIIPMVAVAIGDGKTLARVLVLKPLLRQSYELLSLRLGRLVNRGVYHLPFSRSTPISGTNIFLFRRTHDELARTGGVLITLPEEILSFKLAAQVHMQSDPPFALQLMGIDQELSSIARDIVDESDEILDVKSQLVYTMGTEQQIEGHPNRWIISMEVLARFGTHAIRFKKEFQHLYTLSDNHEGAFPSIRFLQEGASQKLVTKIVDDVEGGLISGLPFNFIHPDTQPLVLQFIRERDVDKETAKSVAMALRFSPHIWQAVLVLRGLIALGHLQFALEQKRFFVDYGLDTGRTLLAVPYRAKGIPRKSSQFGHKEIEILLTALSYYYSGLTDPQIHQSFSLLFEERDATDEYRNWYSRCENFPDSLRHLNNVNLEDQIFCRRKLFPKLRYSQGLVNFFLKKVVFPRHATEYTKRLTGSAWDLPSSSPERLSVGFSGTNDNRSLLPLSIEQHDLPSQQHTNCMVMDLLLQDDNKVCIRAANKDGYGLSSRSLVELISGHERMPSVIIDVGAQILDLTNRDLARLWLEMKPNAQAAVYYDELDEVQVVGHNGSTYPLSSSPLKEKLDHVLIFLDQAHTRGVDLPIPSGATAAVILGPRLSRDRLVQACMRMRKLGNGHSLIFVAPPDCCRSILRSVGKPDDGNFTSTDIVKWTIEQTCAQLSKNAAQWVLQGAEHAQRENTIRHYIESGFIDEEMDCTDPMIQAFMEAIEQPESRSLAQLYNFQEPDQCVITSKLNGIGQHRYAEVLQQKWSRLDANELSVSALGEEQEREVSIEVQKEEIVEHPSLVEARKPMTSPGVEEFVGNGEISIKFRGAKDASRLPIFPVSFMLERTSAVSSRDAKVWEPNNLFVTRDFVETVVTEKSARLDPYLRPIRWILTSLATGSVLIISPHEANELLDDIKHSSAVRLHIYAPRVNQHAANISKLDFYLVSGEKNNLVSWPSAQTIRDINLLSGSLYLDSFEQYDNLLQHLGVLNRMQASYHNPGWRIGGDGFVDAEAREWLRWGSECPFKKSPIPFFQALISIWVKGQDFGSSHLGHITSSKPLRPEDFARKHGQISTNDDVDSLFYHDSAMEEDENEHGASASGDAESMLVD